MTISVVLITIVAERVEQIRRCLEGPHRALAMEKLRAVVEDSVDFSPGHGCGWSTGEEELAIDLYCGLKALSQEKHRSACVFYIKN